MRPKRPLDHPHSGLHEIDWNELVSVCRKLALEIERHGECDVFVGIGKGGCIIGALLSAMLRRDFYPMRLSRRYAGERTQSTTRVLIPSPRTLAGLHVILCDDLSITGETFKIVRLELKGVGARVTTLAFAAHEKSFQTDYTGIVSNHAFVFPWDREVLVDGKFRVHPDIEQAIQAQGLRRRK